MVQLTFIPALGAVLSVIYFALSMIVVVLWHKATKCNPSDPTLALQRSAEARGERFDGRKYEFMCEVC